MGEVQVSLKEEVKVSEDLFLWKGIEKAHKVIIEWKVVSGGIMWIMWWEIAEELVQLLEHNGQWGEAHGLRPNLGDDEVDDHGGGFEEFGEDGVVVVEDGSA